MMDCILSDLRQSYVKNDLGSQHELIVKFEKWSRICINADNAQSINHYLCEVLPIFYSHSLLGCSCCRVDNHMTWTSLLASFLDSKVLVRKHYFHDTNFLSSKDLCMLEFTLLGETVYLIDILLQMNTVTLVPEFADSVAKRIFSVDRSTFKLHENSIRILMFYKWLDHNFSYIVKPTYEQLCEYLHADNVFKWMRQKIQTNIGLAYWKTCTIADKVQALLNGFDLPTLAALLNPSSISAKGGLSNYEKQYISRRLKKKKHSQVEKQKPEDDVCTDSLKEMDKQLNQLSQYLPRKLDNLSSLAVNCNTDTTGKQLNPKNTREHRISSSIEVESDDYLLDKPSKKTKLVGNPQYANTITRDINIDPIGQNNVHVETPLSEKSIIPIRAVSSRLCESPPRKVNALNNGRASTISGSEVEAVFVSPTTRAMKKRNASRESPNIKVETEVVARDTNIDQIGQDDAHVETPLSEKPIIPIRAVSSRLCEGSARKVNTPKNDAVPIVNENKIIGGGEVKGTTSTTVSVSLHNRRLTNSVPQSSVTGSPTSVNAYVYMVFCSFSFTFALGTCREKQILFTY
ncbi:hypothetical protein MN116_003077 [Schistosoma mekongi]|uniref:Uncharacterized protein n=1 Tax=Schistosoma mekongi TaxID=38744 RepID=A0AAE1ZGP4_SCHME|nr:hypothetical protein MN116_003077 [Schistosoma mekongi]